MQTLPSQSAGEAGPGERERSSGKSTGHWERRALTVGIVYLAVLGVDRTGHLVPDAVPHAVAEEDIGVVEGA